MTRTAEDVRKDAENLRDLADRLADLLPLAGTDDRAPDLDRLGGEYLALSLRLERVAARVKERGAAYLGL